MIQLQQALDDAKEIYETIKVTDLITKGINLFELGCNYVFPNGIKIPKKNKVIKLNGVGESINKLLFDRNSPLNIAYNNIIEKYDFHVSDGFLCGISILQILASKINIEEIGSSDNKELIENTKEDEDEDTDDESTEEDGSEEEDESGDEDDQLKQMRNVNMNKQKEITLNYRLYETLHYLPYDCLGGWAYRLRYDRAD